MVSVLNHRFRLFFFLAFLVIGFFFFTTNAFAQTAIYRSVAPLATSNLNTNSRTVTISGTTATFSGTMPDNVGVGDVLQYDPGSGLTLAFISGRTSNTVYTVQSVSGGTPTAAGALTAVSVFRAYTSIQNAENGTENTGIADAVENFDTWSGGRDIATSNEVWNIALYANGTQGDDSSGQYVLFVDGWTTSSTYYLRFYTPTSTSEVGVSQRHSGKWDDSKYHMTDTNGGGYNYTIYLNDLNVWIDGLQIEMAGATAYEASAVLVGVSNSDTKISNNIIRSGLSAGGFQTGVSSSYSAKIWNNIIYGFEDYDLLTSGYVSGATGYVYNNTVVGKNSGDVCISNQHTYVATAKNNIAYNCATAYSGTFAAGTDYNTANNVAMGYTVTGSQNIHDHPEHTFSFVDSTGPNYDYHLSGSDVGAKNLGYDLSIDSNIPFTTDIDGQTRPSQIVTESFTGSDWTGLNSNWTINAGGFGIVSNAAYTGTSNDDGVAYWDTNSFVDNQYAQGTAVALSESGKTGVAVRVASSAETYYGYYGNTAGSELFKYVNGTKTSLGTGAAFAVNDIIKLVAYGTTIVPYKNGAVADIGAKTDSSITSGSPGITGYGDTAGVRIDDWSGANLEWDIGADEFFATVPDAPTIGTATAGNGEATVAFTPPANDGGSTITGYTVTSTPGSFIGTGASSPITVTGLSNGTSYTFTVHATNSVGDSAESEASNNVTPSTVPDAPTIGTATAGNGQATVTFTPPGNDGGATITGYTVTSTPGSFTGTAGSSPIIVSGLTNGTAYTFTVHATNSVGDSVESSASNSITPGYAISGIIYGVDESSPISTGVSIKLSVAGQAAQTVTANGLGAWVFTANPNPTASQIVTIWTDGGTDRASLVFKYGTTCEGGLTNCTGLKLYKDSVIVGVDYNNTSNTIANTDLASCDNDTGTGCADTDIGFTSEGGVLSLTWATNAIRIKDANAKFAPGGAVTATGLKQSSGEFNGGSGTITINGNFTLSGGTATSTSGNMTITGDTAISGTPTFVANDGTVTFGGNLNSGSSALLLYNAVFDGTTSVSGSGGITIASTATVNNTKTLSAGSQTYTLSGSGTPLAINGGTFNANTSTFNFTGSSATTIASTTFNNLGIGTTSDVGDAVTYTLGTGTTVIDGTLTIGNTNSTNPDTLTALTNNSILDVNGNINITSKGALVADDTQEFTVAGNFTNNGIFTASGGTITFDTSTDSIISGSSATTFNNFTSTVAGKTIKFQESSPIYTFAGALTLTGTPTQNIVIDSTTGTQWLAQLTGTANISYSLIRHSGCSSSNNIGPFSSMLNGGDNGSCWKFISMDGSGGGPIDNGVSGGGTPQGGGGQGANGVFTDDFTGTNDTVLSTHDSRWVINSGGFVIYTNGVKGTESGGNGSMSHWNAPLNTDQYAKAVIGEVSGNASYLVGVALRTNPTTQNGYHFFTSGSTSTFGKNVDGSFQNIGGDYGTFIAGDTIEMRVIGSVIQLFKNGSQLGTDVTDATFTTGFPGISSYNGSLAGWLDSWEGGNVIDNGNGGGSGQGGGGQSGGGATP